MNDFSRGSRLAAHRIAADHGWQRVARSCKLLSFRLLNLKQLGVRGLAAVALFLVTAGTAVAQRPAPLVFHLDPATTQIHWTLQATTHTVHGSFKLKSGDVKVDPATGDASGLIVIDATSGESANASRDKRMHSAVLESAMYPTITFRPAHVDGKVDAVAGGIVTVNGTFSLHGQDHPLQLTITLRPKSAATQPAVVALATHFTIPFVAWGLKDPSTFIFRTDKEVAIDIEATATE